MVERRPTTRGVFEGAIAATVCGAGYPIATYLLSLLSIFGYSPDEWAKTWLSSVFGTTLIAVLAFVGRYTHVRYRDKDGEINDLKADLHDRQEKLDKVRSDLVASRMRSDNLEGKVPETALAAAKMKLRDNNFTEADKALMGWIERGGEVVSKILLLRAEWAVARAVAHLRASGLVAAEAYVTASITLWTENRDAILLLNELQILKAEEAHSLPSLTVALAQLQEYGVELVNIPRQSRGL
jgi:hypothetical protein